MKALDRLGAIVGRWRLRGVEHDGVDVRAALRAGGQTVIVLPRDLSWHADIGPVCEELAGWFGTTHLVWIESATNAIPAPGVALPILTFSNAVNRLGLPHHAVIHRVRELAPAIAVDLNPGFDLAAAYLVARSGARLRIGLRGPDEGYYNLQYTWPNGDTATIAEHYARFIAFLRALRGDVA